MQADKLMMKNCIMFEEVFGHGCVTPNMHLHANLCECVEDIGPVFSFGASHLRSIMNSRTSSKELACT